MLHFIWNRVLLLHIQWFHPNTTKSTYSCLVRDNQSFVCPVQYCTLIYILRWPVKLLNQNGYIFKLDHHQNSFLSLILSTIKTATTNVEINPLTKTVGNIINFFLCGINWCNWCTNNHIFFYTLCQVKKSNFIQ